MKKTIDYLVILIFGFGCLYSFSGCNTSKQLAYFNNITKDSVSVIVPQNIQTVISKNDILQITVSTTDEKINATLNNVTALSSTPGVTNGLLVDDSGSIKLPLLGIIKAQGLTKAQLAASITSELIKGQLALDPIVTVRILNYKITVLGEVARPGVIPVPNERITLPEALGQAGDLTAYGIRTNVLLIRESGGKRIYKRFSLNENQMFDKDLYNLQNQDIIYVSPNSAKAATADRSTQLITLGISLVSILLVIYEVFRK